jgi:hypothetical protein
MTDDGMRYDDVISVIGFLEPLGVTDAKRDSRSDSLRLREPLRRIEERRAEVDADYMPLECWAGGDCPRDNTGTASQIQNGRGGGEVQPLQIGLAHLDERSVLSAVLKAIDNALNRLGIERRDRLEYID